MLLGGGEIGTCAHSRVVPDDVKPESVLGAMRGFFFFKRKTGYAMRIGVWSSDVCSSDLASATSSACSTNSTLSPEGRWARSSTPRELVPASRWLAAPITSGVER